MPTKRDLYIAINGISPEQAKRNREELELDHPGFVADRATAASVDQSKREHHGC